MSSLPLYSCSRQPQSRYGYKLSPKRTPPWRDSISDRQQYIPRLIVRGVAQMFRRLLHTSPQYAPHFTMPVPLHTTRSGRPSHRPSSERCNPSGDSSLKPAFEIPAYSAGPGNASPALGWPSMSRTWPSYQCVGGRKGIA